MRKRWKKGSKSMPLPPDDPIFSRGFVIGGRVHRASPETSSKPAQSRGRGLPHQYPWIDEEDFILPGESSKEDADE